MKILTAEQIREADAYTIAHEPVASIDLMERAARSCVDWIAAHLSTHHRFAVFCGPGNNGGDGLAIARMLYELGNIIDVYIIRYSQKCADNFLVNAKRLKETAGVKVHEITDEKSLGDHPIPASAVIIDCIFGSGLNKTVGGLAARAIQHINNSGHNVISIDVPSGMFIDKAQAGALCIKADYTLTFQQPKLPFMFPSAADFAGEFFIIDIGVDEKFIATLPTDYFYVTKKAAHTIYRPRKKISHKGDFGHALLVSGSYGKMGAAVLCARACLCAGAGLLSMYIPACGYQILQTAVPEAMVETSEEKNYVTGIVKTDKYRAVGVGPGIGKGEQTQRMLKLLLQNTSVPLILDADALNILAENKTWLSFLPQNSILTPHPKEFERLAGKWSNDDERLKLQVDFSRRYKVYIVLKGAHTAVACPDGEVYFNSTGNPGMAKAGSGDVLTGVITGLFAQGYDSKQAAVLGVYIHGLAGDIAAERFSQEAMLAGNIIACMGEAFKRLREAGL